MSRFTKEFLIEHHINLNKSLQQIADEFGCSRTTVFNNMRKHNVKTITRDYLTKEINESEILRLYGSGHSIAFIAKQYGVTEPTITSRLKKNNINIRPTIQYLKTIDIPDLHNLYVTQKKSAEEIGIKYNVSGDVILKKLRQQGINVRNTS